MTTAFPLSWPDGWPRTKPVNRQRARFESRQRVYGQGGGSWTQGRHLTVDAGRKQLADELDRLHAFDVVLSTNIVLRLDGQPRSGQAEPEDPGVALYFKRLVNLKPQTFALACDKWDRVADNIAALAKHIEAMRGMDRWGVGTLDRVFTGYAALPPPVQTQTRSWREVLGIPDGFKDLGEIEIVYRLAARSAHPDNGGSHDKMAALNVAIEQARKELGNG
jgi:hypothetical protein